VRTQFKRVTAVAAAAGAAVAVASGAPATSAVVPSGVKGIDVSHHNGTVDWAAQYRAGKRFAYVKATEGSTWRDPMFNTNYTRSYGAGFIRGAYHFASLSTSSASAATQADWFVGHGGGWSRDGRTLPGALDLEGTCGGRTQAGVVSWVASFASRYKARTGRDVVLYTTTSWWKTCTGNSSRFASTNPLWIARYNGQASPGELPAGYRYYSFWQYTSSPIDTNVWNGDLAGLRRMALG
jgi:GH25 family lysozyme M1 (1,4-beta-N-acetylmuramidase)